MLANILRKNTSRARIAGFILSNFIGLAIVCGAIQFYTDASSIWEAEDSFLSSDLLVINRKVTSASTLGEDQAIFRDSDIEELKKEPWVKSAVPFTANDFRVLASVGTTGRSMTTAMFFESLPDSYVDVPKAQWAYREGSDEVPIIMPKDYLALYNFGFASSAGLPKVSEGLIQSIPISLTLTRRDGSSPRQMYGRIAGFSNRINTILVPETFMQEANATLGDGQETQPSRLAVITNSPGDTRIAEFLEAHDYELAGDKRASSSVYLLRVITGIVVGVGGVITLLSLFILLLSVSLIMERNRSKIHTLLMLGYPLKAIAKPYRILASSAAGIALLAAIGGLIAMRAVYLGPVESLGGHPSGIWAALCVGIGLTLAVGAANWISIGRQVKRAFRQ